jgi:hypothetical protein
MLLQSFAFLLLDVKDSDKEKEEETKEAAQPKISPAEYRRMHP